MKNRKGFTLIELLAALVILGLLMAAAVPNVMGIISRNKDDTYIEDAKKLVTRAEYMLRNNTYTYIHRPTGTGNNCVAFSLGFLDNGEFNDPPNGGSYFANRSFVKVCKSDGEYIYYVQLFECGDKNSKESCSSSGGRGIPLTLSSDLVGSNAHDSIRSTSPSNIMSTGLTYMYCQTKVLQTQLDSGAVTYEDAYKCTDGNKTNNGENALIIDYNDNDDDDDD